MVKVLLVEDNHTQIVSLNKLIKQLIPDCYIDMAKTYDNALKLINKNDDYHIFYLDICLSDDTTAPNGQDLGLHIRNRKPYISTPIVFITSFSEKVFEAVNSIHCFSFLVKPYSLWDVQKSLSSLLKVPDIKDKPLFLKSPDGINFKISPSDIICITTYEKGIVITTDSYSFNSRQFTLDSILYELPNNFIRCHKKYIVNSNHIINYDRVTAIINLNNFSIPVGRKYKQDFEVRFL